MGVPSALNVIRLTASSTSVITEGNTPGVTGSIFIAWFVAIFAMFKALFAFRLASSAIVIVLRVKEEMLRPREMASTTFNKLLYFSSIFLPSSGVGQ